MATLDDVMKSLSRIEEAVKSIPKTPFAGPGIGVPDGPPVVGGPGYGGPDVPPDEPPTTDKWVRPRPDPADWPSDWPPYPGDNVASPKLPGMTAFNEAEMVKRARFGYSIYGYRSKMTTALQTAWNEVDRMKSFTAEQAASSRYAYNDYDFAIYGTLIGLWTPTYVYGSSTEPRDYAGYTLQSYFEDEMKKTGGTASGGGGN